MWARVSRLNGRKIEFEVHYRDNTKLLLAYVSEDAAASIARLDGRSPKALALSPAPWGSLTTLVFLPLDRITESDERYGVIFQQLLGHPRAIRHEGERK